MSWAGTVCALVGAILIAFTNVWEGYGLFLAACCLYLPLQYREKIWSQVTIFSVYAVIDTFGMIKRL